MRALLLLALTSCASAVSTTIPPDPPRSAVVIDPNETKHCLRLAVGRARTDEEWQPGPIEPAPQSLADVSPQIRRSAQAAGLEPLLAELLRSSEAHATDEERHRLRAIMRLSTLEIQLSALLFEADCVGDQMEAVLVDLDQRYRRQEIGITIASVLVGAAAGIGAGAWDLAGGQTGPVVFGISGGVASAALAIAAFAPRRDRVVFVHERNLLAPILAGEDPDHLYPSFVFYLLTHAREKGEPTPRDEILEAWRSILAAELEGERRTTAEAVLYGRGGVYDGDLVHVREQMFDVLESHLNAIERDLELLYGFVDEVIANAPAGDQ
jgi:hypothetical protein